MYITKRKDNQKMDLIKQQENKLKRYKLLTKILVGLCWIWYYIILLLAWMGVESVFDTTWIKAELMVLVILVQAFITALSIHAVYDISKNAIYEQKQILDYYIKRHERLGGINK